jgi:predicted NAD/FAD-binding protein
VLEPSNAAAYRGKTLAAYLAENRYSEAFRRHYLLPMCAAVWSVPNQQVLEFPIQMLVRFWVNHHLLDLTQRPKWRVVKDRSVNYVRAVLAGARAPLLHAPALEFTTPRLALARRLATLSFVSHNAAS